MKCLFIFLVSFMCLHKLAAQESKEELAVKDVILNVFDAMRQVDSVALKTCFMDEVTVFTAYQHPKKGNVLQRDKIQSFITSVGTPHDGLYDERLGDYEIKVDGPLASVAVDYYFFLDDKMLHCGVNYFQLFNENDQWKIFFLSDTRRRNPCNLPDTTW